MAKPGQPTMLTPEVIAETARLLPVVAYFETVASYLGLSRMTWRGWLKRGRLESIRLAKEGGEPRDGERLYLEFFDTYKKSIAVGDIKDLQAIQDSGAWQAAAWRQERRYPERWGLNKKEIRELAKGVEEMGKRIAALREAEDCRKQFISGANSK